MFAPSKLRTASSAQLVNPSSAQPETILTPSATKAINQEVKGDGNILIADAAQVHIDLSTHNYSPFRSGYLFQADSIPMHYVPRLEVLREVKDRLVQKASTGALTVTAIFGLAGTGKSVMAAAVAAERDVQEYFSDGVLWVTLGQEPKLLPLLVGLIQTLGDYQFKTLSSEAASSHLRKLLHDKRMLLVVDDVWESNDAELFRVGGASCCVLMTTRESVSIGVDYYDIGFMTPKQAETLFQKIIKRKLTEAEYIHAMELAKAVGYLPLALQLAATQIDDGVEWKDLLSDLRSEVVRLESFDIPGLQLSESGSIHRRDVSLLASLNLSLRRLPSEYLNRFTWMGVLQEDTSITEKAAATLWQISERQAKRVLSYLKHRALLLDRENRRDGGRSYFMHDIVRYYAQRLIQSTDEPQKPYSLEGLGLTMVQAHSRLLDSYKAKCTNFQWSTLPDDSYIHSQLTWHLEKASRSDEIHQLFQEKTSEGRNSWYEACRRLGQPSIFLADLSVAWNIAKQEDISQKPNAIVLQWRYALIQTTLNTLAINIPPILLAALVEKDLWTPAQGFVYAQQIQSANRRAEALCKLLPVLTPDFYIEVLEASRSLSSKHSQAQVRIHLSPYLPEIVPQILSLIEQAENDQTKGSLIRDLAPYLPASLLPQALSITERIYYGYSQVQALSGLSPYLSKESITKAFALATNLREQSYQDMALTSLAPYLTEELLVKSLLLAAQIQHEPKRSSALSGLIPHLPKTLLLQALLLVEQIQDELWRAVAIRDMSPNLPEEFLSDVLALSKKIQNKRNQVTALSGLVSRLPEVILYAWPMAIQMQTEYDRFNALRELAPHLPAALLPQALARIEQIKDDGLRITALLAMVPNFSEIVPQVLATAELTNDDSIRSNIIYGLAPYIPEAMVPRALAIVERIQNSATRLEGLSRMVPYLSKSMLRQALMMTERMKDRDSWAKSLVELIPHRPEVIPQVFELSNQTEDVHSKATILLSLIPHRPEVIPQVFELSNQTEDVHERATILLSLIPHRPEVIPQVFELSNQIEDVHERATILIKLLPYSPETIHQVLSLAVMISEESKLMDVLIQLASHLPVDLLPIFLTATSRINNKFSQSLVVITLASRHPELVSHALSIIDQIPTELWRASALSHIVPYLPEKALPHLLSIADQTQDKFSQATILIGLAPYLPECISKAIATIEQIRNEHNRSVSLNQLAPHLSTPFLSQALLLTEKIKSEHCRVVALSSLIPHLPESLHSRALHLTKQIQDSYERAKALRALLPYMSIELFISVKRHETLEDLACSDRKDFVATLPHLAPAIVHATNEEILLQIVCSTSDVYDQWS